ECEQAVAYASRRAKTTGGVLVLLYVIDNADFQHFLGVEQVMRDEATANAKLALDGYATRIRTSLSIEPELIVREGAAKDEILAHIEEDQDIAILVLAASSAKEGPGPLVMATVGKGGSFPIPVTIVPQTLSEEDMEHLA
ncbi:MAG TPA: universal stress protein, partial [Tianweitania sediminis]|nr:universal stress protein [Tianweitania sediminis]